MNFGEVVVTALTATLAAIGAAIGFGNVWRFPALAHEYGGGGKYYPIDSDSSLT